ncbi:2-succinyl-5-enolpyruvyl-6-hydroxy-3-cyclohexene-1-carboxylic-acid synthase [Fluviicola taffensis]|uniref:2-succinyl-5-enolpyruvyl-6-hydroxy-3-cyclohexene-1-carboxylate synthase n=1 Tax=Fluviicola taffensis (strain DSM 16823 / NCIMB 13979 / RW262) TaxID=755732 RepID=F2ICQ8_FLUTR|nr:2-succinyl-5-enolpyruvyl-6-hydroxy-3-cyclohexene-1-carboxylic-acid synthase [Fluviicola taffensis]AEA42285.1 2-succinyl-5-enolpyruvyl-6-hydroxy-3-cyclohexene-1-carboxylate synthase [Fluviicola taffensis DSM 16823]
MISSAKLEVQLLVDGCKKVGVTHVVISPGSRNAPLSIAFDEDPDFQVFVVPDERVAAFYALGMAQKLNQPVVITCTSGSAPLNYYPAIAEAFYQEIPLIVLSADRPAEWLDQGDGQTIRQEGVFNQMVLNSAQLNEIHTDNQRWYFERKLSEALQTAVGNRKGPIHLNIPFSEPLYETTSDIQAMSNWIELAETECVLTKNSRSKLESIWSNSEKRLIIVGQQQNDSHLQELLESLALDGSVAVLVEHTSNLFSPYFVSNIDRALNIIPESDLSSFYPDCIVTIGGAIISKKIKVFLRQSKAPVIRFGVDFPFMDTFQNLKFTASISAISGIQLFHSFIKEKPHKSRFGFAWKKIDQFGAEEQKQICNAQPWSDLKAMEFVMDVIPDQCNLHISNSSLIRYALLFDPIKTLKYWCNRGTSGIDGSSSTAVGSAIVSSKESHVLVTGDLSFFYDSNAWWSKYLPSNLRIILVNNGGGDIFNIIPGPKSTNQWKKIFVAEQELSAENIAKTYGLDYFEASSLSDLEGNLELFFGESSNDKPKILEINTMNEQNSAVLETYFKSFKKRV